MLQTIICSLAVMAAAQHGASPIPYVGDETSLVRLKATTEKYARKHFVICGVIKLSDDYVGSRATEQRAYDAISLHEYGKDLDSPGKYRAILYWQKDIDKPAMAALADAFAADTNDDGLLARVSATLGGDWAMEGRQYTGAYEPWNILRVTDVQLIDASGKKWGPWIMENRLKKLGLKYRVEWTPREYLEAVAAAKRKQQNKGLGQPARKVRPVEKREFREWVDVTGKHRVKAKLKSMAFGVIKLELESGEVISLPLDRLSAADQQYIRNRSR